MSELEARTTPQGQDTAVLRAAGPQAGAARLPSSMRAAVFEGDGFVRVKQAALPEPGRGQVLVRLEGCGVCASNLPVWSGRPWFQYPMAPGAPGHEGWGEVVALGEGVGDVALGSRVALLSGNAYAEYDVAEAGAVVPIPDTLAGRALPGEPLACAANVVQRSRIEPGQTVAVVGVGFIGALVVQLARAAGARVLALSRRGYALELARAGGAGQVFCSDEPAAAIAAVQQVTGGAGCERVIEAGGEQATLDLASALVATGGLLAIAGYHQDGLRQVDMQSWNWRGMDVVNAHERDQAVVVQGMREAIAAVADGRLDPFPLLTHRFGLDQLPAAFDAMRRRPDGFLKAVVAP
jgi:threonine dehydrogenase-like Zn-dependent dehydrogenase